MTRKKNFEERHLNPETKRGIGIILLFAFSTFLLLAFFHIAGTAGNTLDNVMSFILGWDRFLFPLLLLLFGFIILFPDRNAFGRWNYLGLLFFFLSFNGLIHLFTVHTSEVSTEIIHKAGGIVGKFSAMFLLQKTGFWASVIILTAWLLIAVLLLFNTSLRNVLAVHSYFTGWFGNFLHHGFFQRHHFENQTFSPTQNEISDKEKIEQEEENDTVLSPFQSSLVKSSSVSPVKPPTEIEKILTTRTHRQVALPLDLLEYRTNRANSGDIDHHREMIRRTFEQFHIQVEMAEVCVGPTVTQYSLRPAEGVKLSRIVALQNDIALALAAHPIRIEAPIPGKSLVGIEVPNESVATVSLRELLESKSFKNQTNQLGLALGKDVTGKVWTTPLEKMPHLLVAGATGSGKSVCLNTIIVTLLYENGPDDLRLILIDPKRVELTAYDGIPHLLIPPITKVDDTVNALKWTVREMERRLDVLSKFGVRDITSYNAKTQEKMPRIVVVLDELADLMVASKHEVESTIVRIAQMARAVGIHLIIATQRPSVDVITGIIKANFPARIAFAVTSQTDSRTILDCSGAEKLLGRGDMLYTCAELSKPVRLQGAFIAENEVSHVVNFLRQKGTPDYNYAITEKERGTTILDDDDSDPFLNEAAQIVIRDSRASTSLLQRRLKIGYGRAARILDILEDRGVIGPPDGSRPREVLMKEWPTESVDDRLGFKEREEMLEEEENIEEEKDLNIDEDTFLAAQEGEYPQEDENTHEKKPN